MTEKETRDYITPYAFGVKDTLLGLPLARPMRRFWALMLDLLLASMLGALGGLGAGLVLTGGYAYGRVTMVKGIPWKERLKAVRLRTVGLLLLLAAVASLFDDGDEKKGEAVSSLVEVEGKPVDWEAFGEKMSELEQSDTAKTANVIDAMKTAMVLAATDTAGNVPDPKAQEIKRLKARIGELEDRVDNPGLVATLKNLANDVGLTFGWLALYFVLFPTWLDGQTPAKRWLRIRTIKLNGTPLSWWNNLERFGGYSAGLATGLLGFAQIYWDPNRQTIHDKVTETVVVDLQRERRDPSTF